MLEKKCGSIIQQVKADQSIRIKLHAVQGAAQQKVVGEMHLERQRSQTACAATSRTAGALSKANAVRNSARR